MQLRTFAMFASAAVLFAQPDQREYSGPSVLSRGLAPSISTAGRNIRFQPYLGVNGFCDGGLTGLTIDSNGQVPDLVSCGVEGMAGVHGYREWRKTRLGLDYRGNFRHYPKYPYYDGSDQVLSLGISHQTSKRTLFTLREAAGTYSRNYQLPTGDGFFDSSSLFVPNAELFDNRVYYVLTGADVTYTKSARLSFNMGGTGQLIRRRSSSLYGITGSTAHGDMVYRYSRFGSIGLFYSFTHIEFTKAFGASDFHGVGVEWSLRPTRNWEFGARVGAARVESLLLQTVAVDPVVAAITGQSAGVVAAYHLNYVPDSSVRLTRRFQHASLGFGYERLVTPGNGLYLTTGQEGADADYTYTGIRHWHFSVMAAYTRLIPLLQTAAQYRVTSGGIGVTRDLGKGVQVLVRFDDRYQDLANFRRSSYRGTLGIAWSPSEMPLALW